MALARIHADVAAVRSLTEDVRELTLALTEPSTIDFCAGQYLHLLIPAPQPGQRPLKRAYSICSSPSERGRITLLANLVKGGPGSAYFFSLKAGDQVKLDGPTGQFVLDQKTARDYLFIAMGTGIAPIKSMIIHLCEQNSRRPMQLCWGLRSQRDSYYQELFHALAAEHPEFSYAPTLSQPTDGWDGLRGRVTHILPDLIHTVANLEVYLCGSQHMIADVKAILRTKGLCPIHTEKFY
ncbi:MAG: hypothetical protein HYV03_05220 [Deltaproteobacteria bacterium]|nr:hypothetical protein [Deltaproteobacteria bacterium]